MSRTQTRVLFAVLVSISQPACFSGDGRIGATRPSRLTEPCSRLPPPQPGAPRSWEAAIPVSTYSVANALNRNLLTTIPIFSWAGIGPDLEFNLYHNSAAASATSPLKQAFGLPPNTCIPDSSSACPFSLGMGPGWSTSYSAHVICDVGDLGPACTTLRVVADDGTEDVYTRIDDRWRPPTGLFDTLSWIEFPDHTSGQWFADHASGFRLLHKDQSAQEFDANGRLVRVYDPGARRSSPYGYDTDQALSVVRYDPAADCGGATPPPTPCDRTQIWIVDASGRWLTLQTHNRDGSLWRIYDFGDRHWYMEYFGAPAYENNTLSGIRQVLASTERLIALTSDVNDNGNSRGLIATISDKYIEDSRFLSVTPLENPHTYSYSYDDQDVHALSAVVDPAQDPVTDPPRPSPAQSFATGCGENSFVVMTYTDRRGKAWKYESSWDPNDATSVQSEVHAVENPLGERTETAFTGGLMTRKADASGNAWEYKYDERGNLTASGAVVDPSARYRTGVSRRYYDAYNNVTWSVVTPGEIMTGDYKIYSYELPEFPTLVTKIVGSSLVVGNGGRDSATNPVTRFEYYTDADDPATKRGLLKRVIDPNGVVTFYDYDNLGQPSAIGEGAVGGGYAYSVGLTMRVASTG